MISSTIIFHKKQEYEILSLDVTSCIEMFNMEIVTVFSVLLGGKNM